MTLKGAGPHAAEAGRSIAAPDEMAVQADLMMLDLPALPDSPASEANIYAAALTGASTDALTDGAQDAGLPARWRGGTLYRAAPDGGLLDLIAPMRAAADAGRLQAPIGGSTGLLTHSSQALLVRFDGPDTMLGNIDEAALLDGQNMMILGREIVQFARAEFMGDGQYKLSGLYRALGDGLGGGLDNGSGVENGHVAGTLCILLNRNMLRVSDSTNTAQQSANFALVSRGVDGISQSETSIVRALRPLPPVHLTWQGNAAGGGQVRWVRRSRLPHRWRDGVDMPLAEEQELYNITFWPEAGVALGGDAPAGTPLIARQSGRPELSLTAEECDILRGSGGAAAMLVRQLGTYAASRPALLGFNC